MASAEFTGNMAHTLDSNSRAIIPSAFYDQLGMQFTVALNNQSTAIALFPQEKWDDIREKLKKIPDSDALGMKYVRHIMGNAFTQSSLDSQRRLVLPQTLRQRVGLVKRIRFVGVGDYLEIWDDDRYKAEVEATETAFDALLTHVNERYFIPKE